MKKIRNHEAYSDEKNVYYKNEVEEMLKLPVCPYCNTVYYYGEVVKSAKEKSMECYHCKRKFKITKLKGRIILYAMLVPVIGTIDVLMMFFTGMKTAKPMIAFTVISVSLSLLLLPFTVRYRKIKTEDKSENQKE